jgi:D-amino-acid dehydrogenase
MRVIVLGSGVVGVTSAWYLAQAGHEVTVIDRQPAAALETSFGNAGEISPGYASPWAGPNVPLKAIKWLTMKHGPFIFRPNADPAMWRWLVQMLGNCTTEAYRRNKARMVPLAEYSRDSLRDLREVTGIEYDQRTLGTLQLFRTAKQMDGVPQDTSVLDSFGVPYQVLDRAGCVQAEPALALVSGLVAGGLRLPGDETGDCHKFTQALAALAAAAGVTFRYGTTIERVLTQGDMVSGLATSAGVLTADRYVVALASFSPILLKPLGLDLPIYPVKGYSLTIPITEPDYAPVSTVMDETYKVALTRLGDRIRVGGTAEISGYNQRLPPSRRGPLEQSVGDLFPRGGDLSKASFWTGLRPMTPDGTPIVGGTKYRNLFLNTGHGTLGWTMSCGSGRLIADLVSERRPNIPHDDLALSRYARAA